MNKLREFNIRMMLILFVVPILVVWNVAEFTLDFVFRLFRAIVRATSSQWRQIRRTMREDVQTLRDGWNHAERLKYPWEDKPNPDSW